jgi:hypothetical protein
VAPGDTFSIAGVPFTCVDDHSVGSATINTQGGVNNVEAGDTFSIAAVPFTCVGDHSVGSVTATTDGGNVVTAGDTLTIAGVVFTAVNPGPAVAANQEFLDKAAATSDALVATSLIATINDAASIALVDAAAGPGNHLVASSGGGAIVTLTAALEGTQGRLVVTPSDVATLVTVAMDAPTVPVAANQEFGSPEFYGVAGVVSNALSAASLVATINNAASVALVEAAAGPLNHLDATDGGGGLVTLAANLAGAQGQLVLAAVLAHANTITLVAMDAPTVPVAANQEFGSPEFYGVAGVVSNAGAATSLAATINNAASVALVEAAAGPLNHLDAVAPGAGLVTLTANLAGAQGQLALVPTVAAAGTLVTVAMAAPTAPVAANQEFGSAEFYGVAGVDNDDGAATSLAATINNAVSQLLISATVPIAATAALHVVSLQAAATNPGAQGDVVLTKVGGSIAVSGAGTMTHVALVPGNGEFGTVRYYNPGGTNVMVGTALTAAIDAVIGAGGTGLVTVANGAGTLATVTVTAVADGGAGEYTLVSSTAVRLPVSGATLARTNASWNTSLTATAAALIARVDAGSALALANINTVLLANAVAEFTTAGGSASVGVVTELLAIMSGRGYTLPRLSPTTGLPQVKFTGTAWDPTVMGAFTHGILTADPDVNTAGTIGGVVRQIENKGIRHTVDSGDFQLSVASGHLQHFAAGVTLFPDSDQMPFIPNLGQKVGSNTAQVNNARLVTVYSDTGSVLA